MYNGKMQISEGVEALLANAHAPIPKDDFYTFDGDLSQMAKAAKVATDLGYEVGYAGGIPYVVSKKEYNKVVQYIIEHKIEGYWNYT